MNLFNKKSSLIISNLIKDKLLLIDELKMKDFIIKEQLNKINEYERSLICQK